MGEGRRTIDLCSAGRARFDVLIADVVIVALGRFAIRVDKGRHQTALTGSRGGKMTDRSSRQSLQNSCMQQVVTRPSERGSKPIPKTRAVSKARTSKKLKREGTRYAQIGQLKASREQSSSPRLSAAAASAIRFLNFSRTLSTQLSV
jgi:hypothetical protein